MVRIGPIRSVVRIFDSRLYLVCIFIYGPVARSEIRFGPIIGRDFKNDVNSKLTISDRSGFSKH